MSGGRARPRVVDVAVVGGGIVGTAAALELARGGASVALFEAGAIGAGASGRNSGTVQHPFDEILAPLHLRTVERYQVLAQEAPDLFAFPSTPAGLLLLAGASEIQALETDAGLLAGSAGSLRPTLLRAPELRQVEPGLAEGLVALRLDTAYPVPPAAAVHAFAALAEGAGVRIEVGVGAAIARENGKVAGIRAADGVDHAADAVLIAAGPATPEIVDPSGGWLPIVRTWGVTVAVRLANPPRHVLEQVGVAAINRPDGIETGRTTGPATVEPEGHFASTFSMVTAGGVSVVGSTFLPQEPDPGSVGPLLLHRADRFVPGLHGIGVEELRACARPQSLDGRPLVGRLPGEDRLYVAAGHGPWGISTGPETARLIADLILGRSPAIPPELDPARFPR